MRTSSKARQTIKHLMMRLTWKMPPKGHLANNGQLPEENSIEEGTFKNEWKTQKPGNLVNLGHQFYQHSSRSLNKLIYFIKETKTSLVFLHGLHEVFQQAPPSWWTKICGLKNSLEFCCFRRCDAFFKQKLDNSRTQTKIFTSCHIWKWSTSGEVSGHVDAWEITTWLQNNLNQSESWFPRTLCDVWLPCQKMWRRPLKMSC